MLKYIALFLISANCFASGKVSVEPEYFLNYKKPGAKTGLSVYQHLFGPLNYNGWTGAGIRPKYFSRPVFYAVSHHSLEFWVKKVSVAPGYTFAYNNAESGLPLGTENVVSLKLTYQLW